MDTSIDTSLTLGIDIGGTNTVFGAVDCDGRILAKGSIPTTGHPSFSEFIDAVKAGIDKALTEAGIPAEAIRAAGVGAPCINTETGVIEGAVNLPWPSPLSLTYELTKALGIPVAAENDANAAALGEMCYGSAKGLGNFIMLTLGTGVGSGIVCDGRLLRGKRGLAGELGHVCVCHDDTARECNCGRKGCLDAYASARGVIATARELIDSTSTPSSLRSLTELTAKDVGTAAAEGDPLATEALRRTGRILGKACADFAAFSSPEAFIFFGGVARSFNIFENALQEAFREHLLWVYEGQVRFILSSLPAADAALLGAAAAGRTLLLNQTNQTQHP